MAARQGYSGISWLSVPVQGFLTFVGESTLLLGQTVSRLARRPFEFKETLSQMAFLGVSSVPIVALTGFFWGAVLSLYLSSLLISYKAVGLVGGTMGLAMCREMAPVLAGVMVAARCGSAMAAQIANMKVTEQIDALKMLSVHPVNYLVIPRVLACALMMPVLSLIGMYSGMVGGFLVAKNQGVPAGTFMQSVAQYVTPHDFVGGMIKTPIFGVIIALVACQQGLRAEHGATGVGRATTNSVVISMVLVYVINYYLASVLFR